MTFSTKKLINSILASKNQQLLYNVNVLTAWPSISRRKG
jgi:hypothetical protein